MDPVASVVAPSGLLLAGSVASLAAALWLLLPKSTDTVASRRLGILLGALALVGFAATGRTLDLGTLHLVLQRSHLRLHLLDLLHHAHDVLHGVKIGRAHV